MASRQTRIREEAERLVAAFIVKQFPPALHTEGEVELDTSRFSIAFQRHWNDLHRACADAAVASGAEFDPDHIHRDALQMLRPGVMSGVSKVLHSMLFPSISIDVPSGRQHLFLTRFYHEASRAAPVPQPAPG